MPNRSIKLRKLRQILKRYSVLEDASGGKGSHIKFIKQFPEGRFSYTIPNEVDVKVCYVKGCRRRFLLTPEEGVSDREFYEQ